MIGRESHALVWLALGVLIAADVALRVGRWLRRGWSLATDVHGDVESEVLVQALVVVAVVQARREQRCARHEDRPSVVRVRLTDGTVVGWCRVCATVRTAAELAGPPGVAVAA